MYHGHLFSCFFWWLILYFTFGYCFRGIRERYSLSRRVSRSPTRLRLPTICIVRRANEELANVHGTSFTNTRETKAQFWYINLMHCFTSFKDDGLLTSNLMSSAVFLNRTSVGQRHKKSNKASHRVTDLPHNSQTNLESAAGHRWI